MIFNIFRR